MSNDKSSWAVSVGFYPGIVIGMRSYYSDDLVSHVLYLPFFDVALQFIKD